MLCVHYNIHVDQLIVSECSGYQISVCHVTCGHLPPAKHSRAHKYLVLGMRLYKMMCHYLCTSSPIHLPGCGGSRQDSWEHLGGLVLLAINRIQAKIGVFYADNTLHLECNPQILSPSWNQLLTEFPRYATAIWLQPVSSKKRQCQTLLPKFCVVYHETLKHKQQHCQINIERKKNKKTRTRGPYN